MRLEVRERRGRATTDEAKAHGEVEMPMIKRKLKRLKGERTVDTPTWGWARAGTVEAWVKRVKRVSMGLTVNRQMAKKFTVNRQKRSIFTVNRQMS